MNKDKYLHALVKTVHRLLRTIFDPSVEDIAEAHFGNAILGEEIYVSIRRRLSRIRYFLEVKHGLSVYLVSGFYYENFRDKELTDERDARLCLPGGYGKKAEGLRVAINNKDLIFKAAEFQNSISGAAKVKKATDRVLDAVEADNITKAGAAEIVDEIRSRLIPNKPDVLRALPTKDILLIK